MKRIIKERGTGKTYELVKLSAEKQIPILCMSKEGVLDRAKELNVKIPQPISIWDYEKGLHRGRDIESVLVDDSEYILQRLLEFKINALTVTKPKEVTMEEIGDMIGHSVGDFVVVE